MQRILHRPFGCASSICVLSPAYMARLSPLLFPAHATIGHRPSAIDYCRLHTATAACSKKNASCSAVANLKRGVMLLLLHRTTEDLLLTVATDKI